MQTIYNDRNSYVVREEARCFVAQKVKGCWLVFLFQNGRKLALSHWHYKKNAVKDIQRLLKDSERLNARLKHAPDYTGKNFSKGA